jgi:DNA-binding response OmpR family regulator
MLDTVRVRTPHGVAQDTSGMTVTPDIQRILIVEDDPGCSGLLQTIFRIHGFQIAATDSVLGGMELVDRFRPHVILLDLGLPYRSGASWLVELKSSPDTQRIPVVILSATPDVLPQARRQLVHAVVSKPFRARTLVETVQAACSSDPAKDGTTRDDSASNQPLGSL